jgi:hypothetical protein
MPESSPSRCIPPSPPPQPDPIGAPTHRSHFEMRVIPLTAAIDDAEAALVGALVVSVGGTQPQTSLT